MTKSKLYILSILVLLATVPWFFTKESDIQILGFPLWAFYSICMTVVYAIVIAIIIYFYWHVLAGDDES